MKSERLVTMFLILGTIFLGLLSRKFSFIPLFAGDALYAVMMFLIVRFILISKKLSFVAIISLSICFLIEISQLYQADWINLIRKTLPGRLILGQGFLLSDLLAYFVGTIVVWLVAEQIFQHKKA